MKIAVYRQPLILALERILKIIPSSKVSPILTYGFMLVDEDKITLTATDLSVFISTSVFDVKVGDSGTILVPVVELISALKSVSVDAVVLSDKEGTLQLRAGNTGWNWKKRFTVDMFPKIPVWEESNVYIFNRKNFIDVLRRVKTAAPYNSFSSNLEQVGIRNSTIQAADGIRFHQCRLSQENSLNTAFPLPFAKDLIATLSLYDLETFEIGLTSNQDALVVRCGDMMISTKTRTEKFPDIENSFLVPAMKNHSFIKISRTKLIESIRRVTILADKDSRAVTLKISVQDISSIEVSASLSNGSFSMDRLSIVATPENRVIILNADHLLQALSLFEEDEITLLLGEDQKHKPSTVLIKSDASAVVLNQLRLSWT